MRHLAQPQDVPEVAPLGEQRGETAVIRPQELSQHQHGKELRLGEVVPRAAARVRRQGSTADGQGFPRQAHGRFRHGTHRFAPDVLSRGRLAATARNASFQQSKMNTEKDNKKKGTPNGDAPL